MPYAQDTSVSVEKSRAELEQILARYGASSFGYLTEADKAIVAFKAHGKAIRFTLPIPSIKDVSKNAKGFILAPKVCQSRLEQEKRSRWRALCLCVKAKLEAVERGISEFETEFLANIVLPNGKTMGEHCIPMIEEATKSGKMPSLSLMS